MIPYSALRQMFETLSGGLDTAWENAPRGAVGMQRDGFQAWIDLQLVSYVELNIDEQRLHYDATTDANDVLIAGQRNFTMSVIVRALDLSYAAFEILERIRFRLRTNTARNLFVPAGLALVRIEPIVHLGQDFDNHSVSKASMDVRFAQAVGLDPGDDDGNYIASVDTNDEVVLAVSS